MCHLALVELGWHLALAMARVHLELVQWWQLGWTKTFHWNGSVPGCHRAVFWAQRMTAGDGRLSQQSGWWCRGRGETATSHSDHSAFLEKENNTGMSAMTLVERHPHSPKREHFDKTATQVENEQCFTYWF